MEGTLDTQTNIKATFYLKAHPHLLDIINKANLVIYGLAFVDDNEGVCWAVAIAAPTVVAPMGLLARNDVGGPT